MGDNKGHCDSGRSPSARPQLVRAASTQSTLLDASKSSSPDSDIPVVLFQCSFAKIISFTSLESKTHFAPPTSPSSKSERILARGSLKLYRIRAHNSAFLQCGNIVHPVLKRSRCWKLSEFEYIFSLPTAGTYWRIELDSSEVESAVQFEHTLSEICRLQNFSDNQEDMADCLWSQLGQDSGNHSTSPIRQPVLLQKAAFERLGSSPSSGTTLTYNRNQVTRASVGSFDSSSIASSYSFDHTTPDSQSQSSFTSEDDSDLFTSELLKTPTNITEHFMALKPAKTLRNGVDPSKTSKSSPTWYRDSGSIRQPAMSLSFAQQERNKPSSASQNQFHTTPPLKHSRRRTHRRSAKSMDVAISQGEKPVAKCHKPSYSVEDSAYGWSDLQFDAADLSYQPYGILSPYTYENGTVVSPIYGYLGSDMPVDGHEVTANQVSNKLEDDNGRWSSWLGNISSWLKIRG